MRRVTILPETTKNPITLIGNRAGICWGADISDDNKNYKRGIDCIKSGHGRTLEFPDVHLLIEGYSARVIREYYTHIGCLPTRLQESTRYVDCNKFYYVVPDTVIKNNEALKTYNKVMKSISDNCKILTELGIPREDVALLLPLGMTTKIVDKRNLRNFIDMSRNRDCTRANWEFRLLMKDIENSLSTYSEEWKYLVKTEFKPKCEVLGYCPEKNGCGRKPNKKRASKVIDNLHINP